MFVNSQVLRLTRPIKYAYSQIILFGLNFSFTRKRGRKIILNLQYAYNFGFRLPHTFVARIYKRRFVLYADKLSLLRFIKELVEMRQPNIYTGKGLRLRSLPYRVKPGKVRRR